MQLKYVGAYNHAVNSVSVSITREKWRNERGGVRGYVEMWTISGRLRAADGALTTQIDALELGYSTDGHDLILYEDNGTTPTAHQLISADCVGGVQVDGPTFSEGRGAEYATYRDFTITARGRVESTAAAELLNYSETIVTTGTGGARFIYIQTLRGKPVKQKVAERTTVVVTQDGTATGRTTWPEAAGPILSTGEHKDKRKITRKSPVIVGETAREYEISWHYEFEANAAGDVLPGDGD